MTQSSILSLYPMQDLIAFLIKSTVIAAALNIVICRLFLVLPFCFFLKLSNKLSVKISKWENDNIVILTSSVSQKDSCIMHV